jgi:preprotein translocase subunit SecF
LLAKGHITSEDNVIGLSLNGPSVSNYMKSSTINALTVGIIFIAVYMMFSFAGMRKHISPLTLAIVTIVTMLFDVSIPAGIYGLWMMIDPTVTVDTIFIIALMTTIGYSINDTIIILDRIRENTIKNKEGLEK